MVWLLINARKPELSSEGEDQRESRRRVQKSQMDQTGDTAQEWKDTPASPGARARGRETGPVRCWGWGGGLAAGGPISPEFP